MQEAKPLYLALTVSKGTMKISLGVIEFMNYPNYLMLLFAKNKKTILLKPGSSDDKRSIKVNYKLSVGNHGVRIYSKLLAEKIRSYAGLNGVDYCKISGEKMPDCVSVRFDCKEVQ